MKMTNEVQPEHVNVSRRIRGTWFIVFAGITGLAASASAEPGQLTYTIATSGTALSCTKSELVPVASGATEAVVTVVKPAATVVTVKDGATMLVLEDGVYKVPNDQKPHALSVSWTDPKAGSGTCGDPIDPTTAGAVVAAAGGSKAKADLAASTWSHAQDASEQLARGSRAPRGTVYLVHLPSGEPAFPFPSKLTEGTNVQVVLLVPKGETHTIALSIDSCADVTPFRTTVDASRMTNTADLAEPLVAVPVGQYFSCGAGATSYTLKRDDAVLATTKLTFRPKYTIAAIASLGWDTGRRVTYSAGVRAGSSEATVFRHSDHVGLEDYIGAIWMIGGVDYEQFRWWNYFANVFVAVDPSNPTKDLVAGFAVTPTGGVSLAIGLSFHQGEVLDGISPGDSVDGAVPSHKSWNESGRGLFLGLSVDSRIYDAIVAKFSK